MKNTFKETFKVSFLILAALTITYCNYSKKPVEKATILRADREAPMGWVILTIYQDSTFELVYTGMRKSLRKAYPGTVLIKKDSLFFNYRDSIPRAGSIAVYNDKRVAYIDGEYPERLEISNTKERGH